MSEKSDVTMEKIVSLAKRRGFVFPGSEIYGGLANSWDYGPVGVELKNNIKQLWWKRFVQQRSDVVGLDAALIMNPEVWKASKHTETFNDPLVECNSCKMRYRVDALISNPYNFSAVRDEIIVVLRGLVDDAKAIDDEVSKFLEPVKALVQNLSEDEKNRVVDALKPTLIAVREKLDSAKQKLDVSGILITELEKSSKLVGLVAYRYLDRYESCPHCGKRQWGFPRPFNLMLKTFLGPAEEKANAVYFRPETAQAMFVDFKQVVETSRKQIPFGIAQIGKAFRNEITPGNFIFRTREFEQMEIEYFIRETDWEKWFEHWRSEMHAWMDDIGLDKDKVHELEVPTEELAHYSKRTMDFEFEYPFGKKELYGLAYRTDFDLRNHFKDKAPYRDPKTGEEYWPHVIEPTWGVDRSVLAVLCSAYQEDGERVFLKLPPKIAPYKAAVFPLLANKPQLVELAERVYDDLKRDFNIAWDDRGNIGKRYYAQDEIGTPFCITVDFDSLEKGDVTIRDRDTAEQTRVTIASLRELLAAKLAV